MLSLKEKYTKEVLPAMMKEFSYKNVMAVPKIEKVVLNIGFGKTVSTKTSDEQKKFFKNVSENLASITGQKPVLTSAKKAIAGFKTRKGMLIGAMDTLRKKKMYDFLEKLIYIALPRTRDFRGIDLKSFDNEGNLTISIKEYTVFPEVILENTKVVFGFEITIVTTTKNREQGIGLLKLMGFPLKPANSKQRTMINNK
jgi:large subunit ribosomal protein L5